MSSSFPIFIVPPSLVPPSIVSSPAVSRPDSPATLAAALTDTKPIPSCILQPRAVTWEQGVIPIDILRIGAPSMPASLSAVASPHSPAPAVLPHPHQHQARLEPIYHALAADARERRSTNLTYSSWLHQSSLYFNAAPNIAKLLWQTFLVVHRSAYSTVEQMNQKTSTPTPPTTTQQQPTISLPTIRLEVDLAEFMIFLFVQRFESFRSSQQQSSTTSTAAASMSPSDLHRSFLVDHLIDILQWCRDLDRHDSSSLTAREFNRLAIVIQGLPHPQETKEIRHLAQLTPFYTVGAATATATAAQNGNGNGNGRASATTNCRPFTCKITTLASWVTSQLNRPSLSVSLSLAFPSSDTDGLILHVDPHHSSSPSSLSLSDDPPTPIAAGSGAAGVAVEEKKVDQLDLLPVIDVSCIDDRSIFFRRNADGDNLPPLSPGFTGSFSSSALSQSNSGSTFERSIPIGSFLNIHDCTRVAIYLTMVTRFITIRNVTDSILHLGVISHQVQLVGLRNCTVWLVAPSTHSGGGIGSNIHIAKCQNIKVYLYTNGTVQLIGNRPPAISADTAESDSPTPPQLDLDAQQQQQQQQPAATDVTAAVSLADVNSQVTLAPYNTSYGDLLADLQCVGVTPSSSPSPPPATITAATTAATAAASATGTPIVSDSPKAAPSSRGPAFRTNTWSTYVAIEPIQLPTTHNTHATTTNNGSANANGNTSTSSASNEPNKASIAGGGRKGKALGQLQSSSMVTPPIYLTFPLLVLPKSVSSSPLSPSSSSSSSPSSSSASSSASSTLNAAPAAANDSDAGVALIDPHAFFPMALPAECSPDSNRTSGSPSSASTNPFRLPAAFLDVLRQRHSQALENRCKIDSSSLTPSQHHTFTSMLQGEFQSWLTLNYSNHHYLTNLLRSDEAAIRIIIERQQRQRAINIARQQQHQAQIAAAAAANEQTPTTPTRKQSVARSS